jgi:NAD(P)-dependent dehydrogenase (short-subunit alcohol dehydrogenase family)
MGRLEGKVAVVTGAALGIGRATAELFAREGAAVAVTDLNEKEGRAVADGIASSGGRARFWKLDVSMEADVKAVFKGVQEAFGPVTVLVNNAGVGGARKPVHELSGTDWDRVLDVNVKGVFNCTKHAVPMMLEAGGGSIVNVASVLGVVGGADNTPYVASKAAVRLMSRSDALTYATQGIRVNTVSPGFVWTPLIEKYAESTGDAAGARKALEELHPVGRLGEPVDVAYGALYLASDEARFVTGAEIAIDGGYTAK